MQVAWNQPRGLQRGGDGCKLLPPPCSWGTRASPYTGLHVTFQAAALRYGFGPAVWAGGEAHATGWFTKPNCKKNDLSAGVLAAALKQCMASLRLFPRLPLAGR